MSQESARSESPVFTNFDGQKLPIPKPTFAALSEAMVNAAESLNGFEGLNGLPSPVEPAFGKLRDQLFLSPRLSQWQFSGEKSNRGYWLKSKDESATIMVREDKVILALPDRDYPKHPVNHDVVTDSLAAATLFKSIQDAQKIIQRGLDGMPSDEGESEEFFGDEPEYIEGAGLDAALEETHADPLIEDDAELIEEVTAEEALDEDQRREDGPQPVIKVSQQFIEDISQPKTDSFTASANRRNAVTDGVICSYCGNLNQSAYKGTCPKCPRLPSDEGAKQAALI